MTRFSIDRTRRCAAAVLVLGALLWGCADPAGEPAGGFDLDAWEAWRADRIASLTAEDGWLGLIGLYWLAEGVPARFGVSPDAEVVLPPRPSLADAPPVLGTLLWSGDRVTLTAAAPDLLTIDGEPAPSEPIEVRTDTAEEPSLIEIGTVELTVIERADEVGIRARDRASERRALIAGVDDIPFFPVSERYFVDARFEPKPPGSTIGIVNILGQVTQEENPGTLTFELDGRELTLEALAASREGRYFLLIGDQTNGEETYGGGRYLYADRRPDGGVDLDLNRLYNPPCVFTEFATCPLPPRSNRLAVRIEAGEKLWEGDLH